MNVYDVRLTDDWPACGMNWPPDLPDLYAYLRVSTYTLRPGVSLTIMLPLENGHSAQT